MKKLVLLTPLLLVCLFGKAQDKPKTSTFAFEVDPIAYLLHGYSVHGVYQPNRWSLDFGLYGLRVPEKFHGNEGFTTTSRGYGLKVNYSLQSSGKGFFTGVGAGNGTTLAKHRESGAEGTGHSWSIRPQFGYRLFLQEGAAGKVRGFYITPWISLDYQFQHDKIKFNNLDYKESRITPFATIHVGYRF